jgi:hypothetical protein
VPAERHHPPTRAPDVAEQQLHDRTGADVLHADAVLRPANRVDESRGPLGSGVLAQRLRDGDEILLAASARLGYHLGRIACEMPADDLQHAVLVLHRVVNVGWITVLELHAVRAVRLLA